MQRWCPCEVASSGDCLDGNGKVFLLLEKCHWWKLQTHVEMPALDKARSVSTFSSFINRYFNQFSSDTAQYLSANMVFTAQHHIKRSLWCLYLSPVLQLRVFNHVIATDLLTVFTHVCVLWWNSACDRFTMRPGVVTSEFFRRVHHHLTSTSTPLHFQVQKWRTWDSFLKIFIITITITTMHWALTMG